MKTIKSQWEMNNLDIQLIHLAFQEDLGSPYKDVTTNILFPNINSNSVAKVISKNSEPIILCGLPVINQILSSFNVCYELHSDYHDGNRVLPGKTLLTISASSNKLLMMERTMLNFLQHLCAIATLTAKFVERVKHTTTKILDTRKTLPGFRHLDKYAVQCGGGENHRMGLYDAIMIKDTHIDSLGGIEFALAALPVDIVQKHPVIVEVRTLNELRVVLEKGLYKITRVLLDNMSPELIVKCVRMCEGLVATEASGNIDLDNVVTVAECGVDFISIGKLTHSAGNANLSMICEI